MRAVEKTVLAAILLSMSILASLQQARATDLIGAWATSSDECKNMFVRKGGTITFAPMSEIHGGGGFIVERLEELIPPVELTTTREDFAPSEWAHRWPAQWIWVARRQ